MVGGVRMKRVKYTNTKIDALNIFRLDIGPIIITDDALLRIEIEKVRNSSKNHKAVCHVKFLDKLFVVEKTSSQIIKDISNLYLYLSLSYVNINLRNSLFYHQPMVKNLSLTLYIWVCALYKYGKEV